MGLGQPTYVSVPSSGGTLSVSAWQPIDLHRNPTGISFSIVSLSAAPLSSQAQIQVTLDDGSNPYGLISVWPASAFGGPPQSSNAAGSILAPITAWRLANTSSAGTALATAVQSGPR
jgi:hypothetical protein